MKKVFKSTIILLLLFFTSTIFSCKNFFAGAALKEEIEKAIEYANSSLLTVLIAPENPSFGSVIGNSEQKVKVSDEIKLRFNCNDNYIFIGWKVYIDDIEDTDGNYVEIFDSHNENATARIKKASEKIVIRPICSDYLKVESVSPDWGEIYSEDSAIVANFNTEISLSNFRFSLEDFEAMGYVKTVGGKKVLENYVKTYSDSEGSIYAYELYDDPLTLTYKNINIQKEEENFLSYFGIPFVHKNILTIPVNYKNLIPIENNQVFTLNVSLSKDITSVYGITMRADKSWLYKITNELELLKDETPPAVLEFKAAKNSTALAENKLFVEKAIDDFTKNEYLKNGISDSLFVSFQSKDIQSGINKFVITEKMTNDRKGVATPGVSPYITEYPFESLTISEDRQTATLETDYKIKTKDDGAICLTIYAVDNNNNPSEEKKVTVITHNNIYLTDWNLSNEDDVNKFVLKTKKGILYKDILIDFNFDILYGYDPLNISTSFRNKVNQSDADTFTFTKDDVSSDVFEKNIYLKVVATDDYGISNYFIMIIPANPKVLYTNYYPSQSSDSSGIYYYYTTLMHSSYGIKFANMDSNSPKKQSTVKYSRNTAYPYSMVYNVPDEHKENNIWNYYESDYGYIKCSGNTGVTISTKTSTSGSLELKDEFSQPITYDVTAVKEEAGYVFYKVTVSNPVKSKANPGTYASYLLEIKKEYVSFDGTETTVMIPVSDNVRPRDFILKAVDSLYISGQAEIAHNDEVSSLGWSLEGYSGLIRLINYNVKAKVRVGPEQYIPDPQFEKYQNNNYSPDYIKILPPNENASSNSVKKLTAYIKPVDQYLVDYMENNKVEFKSYGSSDNKSRINNPNLLIEDGLLTYEDIEQVKGINISTDESSIDGYQIPVWNLKEGSYVIFVKLEDQNGKPNWGSCYYKRSKSRNILTSESFKLSGTTITAEILDSICRRVKVDYLNAGNWSKAGEAEIYKQCRSVESYKALPEKNTVTINNKSSWMKIYCSDSLCTDTQLFGAWNNIWYIDSRIMPLEYYYHAPVYIYPNGSTVPQYNSSNVGLKNIIEEKALSVLCTQPALVQTFCSPVNYKENAEDWEYHTGSNCVLNPVVIPAGGGNYEIPVNDIPSGYYYCAIVRYSDGTTLMSTIKKN